LLACNSPERRFATGEVGLSDVMGRGLIAAAVVFAGLAKRTNIRVAAVSAALAAVLTETVLFELT
jgi:hypothetical protein